MVFKCETSFGYVNLVNDEDESYLVLHHLFTPIESRRLGYATEVLEQIKAYAISNNLELRVHPYPGDNERSESELKDWYMNRDFVDYGDWFKFNETQ